VSADGVPCAIECRRPLFSIRRIISYVFVVNTGGEGVTRKFLVCIHLTGSKKAYKLCNSVMVVE
jgi:hypothetical protein